MFTGIISSLGTVTNKEKRHDTRLVIHTSFPMHEVAIGASIACSGACMTVVEKGADWFAIDVSDESLSRTLIGGWEKGIEINLERSLRLGDELGGHMVTGHVDGLAKVLAIDLIGGSHRFTFQIPDHLKKFVAEKGSVTLDGISLTVNNVQDNQFQVNIIPHTWEHTTMKYLKPGSKMHFEADILARYVLRSREI